MCPTGVEKVGFCLFHWSNNFLIKCIIIEDKITSTLALNRLLSLRRWLYSFTSTINKDNVNVLDLDFSIHFNNSFEQYEWDDIVK